MTIWQWPQSEFENPQMDQEQEAIFGIICSLFDDLHQTAILEPGCGTARISYHLMNAGADIRLCDLSRQAVNGCRHRFRHIEKQMVVRADLLNLPYRTSRFDLVWNSGVMEHFGDNDLLLGLQEMGRVSRRFVAVFVPFADCLPYKVAKLVSEAEGNWQWGPEYPKRSLKDEFNAAGIDVIDEFVFGQQTDIPMSYMRLLPPDLAAEISRDYHKRKPHYPGVSLATIGVKRKHND